MADVLSKDELRGLKEHKYSASGKTLFDPVMQVYWEWLVKKVPLWLAPNALTLFGLVVNIFTTFILILYSPDAKQEAPAWAYFMTAIGLFIYQSLDAIDGKQARRTNSSSPLGELFDHGCDAVSVVFVIMGLNLTLQCGYEPFLLWFSMMLSTFMFYAAHWTTYCTGTLQFGKLDVTEAQFGVMIVDIIAGIFGPSVFSSQLPVVGMPAKMIVYGLSFGGTALAAFNYFKIIFVEGGVGRSRSTVADTSVLGPSLPVGFMLFLSYYIMTNSKQRVYESHPVLYLLAFGMISAKITCRLIVAHMAKSEMELFDSTFVGPLLFIVNQHLLNHAMPEYFLLWVAFVYGAIDLWLYVTRVCRQLCDYLDIFCFKIAPPQKQQSTTYRPTQGDRPSTSSTASKKLR